MQSREVELIDSEDETLKSKLKSCIDNYLETDNPAPKTFWDNASNLFSFRGEEGRQRAGDYKLTIKNFTGDEYALALKVLIDINSEGGDLGSSKVLRDKLLDVCKLHYAFTADDISKKSRELYNTMYGGIMCQYRPLYVESAFVAGAIQALVKESQVANMQSLKYGNQ